MQTSFTDLEYAARKKRTRRDIFLDELERLAPWTALEQAIEPFYPESGLPGRPPIGLARMLRMYLAQQCFGLSDEATEDAVYDSHAIRRFVGVDLGRDPVPDATTLLNFRHLLEEHALTESLFNVINAHLAERGLFLRQGTIVDASLIAAPPSTKNETGKRDPAMHQSKKGKQWYFGMKAHIGVDANSGLVHSVVGTAGNVSDISQAHALLHGDEVMAFGDAGYQGIEKRSEHVGTPVQWQVAMRPGKRRALDQSDEGRLQERLEQVKASIRSKVEHPFHVVKNLFRHRKTRYRGLKKNTAQLLTLFGLANLVLAKRWLLPEYAQGAS
ncbi:MAG: IS5 family transposase [Nitrosomonadales bacterium]|nr:IS5 family transposase [Nitrosomonadales bacterium]